MSDGTAAYAVLPGSGSSGLVWEQAAADLGTATVLPLPDRPSVAAMAAELAPDLEALRRPRVLVGSSLGALVAIELARGVPVEGLVLIAAGFGVEVHRSVLARIGANGPGLLHDMASGVVADAGDERVTQLVLRDFQIRGQGVLLRHMTVLAQHAPQPLTDPPPTLVLWGAKDPGVSLAAHAELALRLDGLLVPIDGAGHLPYLERPQETVRWIRWAGKRAASRFGNAAEVEGSLRHQLN